MTKLSIQNEMQQFDHKNRNFYDELTDDERKKFSNYLMIRWGSSVQGIQDLQEYYLLSVNQRLNKNFFSINKHPKLQWLCATTVSPGMGAHRHVWIAPKKKDTKFSGIRKQLIELFPTYKDDEIDLLAKVTTQKEIDEYIELHGEE